MNDPILELEGLEAGYGDMGVLQAVTLSVSPGTVTAVAGANGAGKTTLLKAILGVLPATAGSIRLHGQDVTRDPVARRIGRGLGLVPEGRGLFTTMSVHENLRLGARVGGKRGPQISAAVDRVLDVFPILREKMKNSAGSMSGGQQQMLSLARVLAADPDVVLLDEPSMGLAPLVWSELLHMTREMADGGTAVLLAEQKIKPVLRVSDHCVVLARGRVAYSGPALAPDTEHAVSSAYLETAPTAGAAHD